MPGLYQDLHWCLGVCVHFCVRPMVFLTSSLVRVGTIRYVHTRVQAKLTVVGCAVVTHVPALPTQTHTWMYPESDPGLSK